MWERDCLAAINAVDVCEFLEGGSEEFILILY